MWSMSSWSPPLEVTLFMSSSERTKEDLLLLGSSPVTDNSNKPEFMIKGVKTNLYTFRYWLFYFLKIYRFASTPFTNSPIPKTILFFGKIFQAVLTNYIILVQRIRVTYPKYLTWLNGTKGWGQEIFYGLWRLTEDVLVKKTRSWGCPWWSPW